MLAETTLLTLDTSYLLFKYLFFHQHQSNESRSDILYYVEFLFDVFTLSIDILHHLQMLFYHQTFMSMSSLIFFPGCPNSIISFCTTKRMSAAAALGDLAAISLASS